MKQHPKLSTREQAVALALAHRRTLNRKVAFYRVKRVVGWVAAALLAAVAVAEVIGLVQIVQRETASGW
jgi:adenine/guanine phosphoribosyltransferase-like PRPP-binding protein